MSKIYTAELTESGIQSIPLEACFEVCFTYPAIGAASETARANINAPSIMVAMTRFYEDIAKRGWADAGIRLTSIKEYIPAWKLRHVLDGMES